SILRSTNTNDRFSDEPIFNDETSHTDRFTHRNLEELAGKMPESPPIL
ncbi:unnamed protein product, partial [Rotaria magnacalcarata]